MMTPTRCAPSAGSALARVPLTLPSSDLGRPRTAAYALEWFRFAAAVVPGPIWPGASCQASHKSRGWDTLSHGQMLDSRDPWPSNGRRTNSRVTPEAVPSCQTEPAPRRCASRFWLEQAEAEMQELY